MRRANAQAQLDALRDQLETIQSGLQDLVNQINLLGAPQPRGPLGLTSPFGRKSASQRLWDRLSTLQSRVTDEALPAITGQPTGPDWGGVFIGLALVLGAVGAALLWMGGPRRAADTLTATWRQYAGSRDGREARSTVGAG